MKILWSALLHRATIISTVCSYNNGIVFSCSDRWVDPLVDTDVFMAILTGKICSVYAIIYDTGTPA